ncbi:paraquat-inducible protein A [Shewanella sp. Choline-02u-19]|uniref:paraquat-inducible protein A n=1 Tax=unclassified Shewanella TaxID=196818 RepID=UPI000C32DAF7|nr:MULTISPECIES: paraquat-inducible protein A [unclassified Shewanella]PKG57558.1 paraquat-inducible protein A [Shewanella sp. GutDb-MelDb]PKG72687.1 paraquat-inducible protein A [Shewanella sp. GutCb]PKH56933.1 paraquat-inducible protein A [Shewanella sp. Bg11-22]PKI27730.1 paraquat-inducible protein A [Shewanella sp. Choline-02u-19]
MTSDALDNSVTLCRSCDLVIRKRALPTGVRALCPRCHTQLYDTPYCSLNGMLALCITAIIFFFPANTYPVLELEFLGSMRTTTVLEGALAVYQQGYWIVAIAVMTAAVIAPGILLMSILIQIVIIKHGLQHRLLRSILKQALKLQGLLTQLTMLEIYVISFLVAAFNLADFATVSFGFGTFCFTMLFIMNLFLLREYDLEHMWSFLEK